MKQLFVDLKKAVELLNTPAYSIPRFERIYSFSNENLVDLFQYFDVKDKECLSVLGSSDQVFDLFLHGAKRVDSFDMNSLAIYYFYLKKAAIEAGFSRDDFINFFNDRDEFMVHNSAFSYSDFLKLKPFLHGDALKFWDVIFSKSSKYINLRYHLFSREKLSKEMLPTTVGYLSEDGYMELQKNISKIDTRFYSQNLLDLAPVLEQSYDFMYLSNIIQYADGMFQNTDSRASLEAQISNLEDFKNILDSLSFHLNKEGKIMAGYIYAMNIPSEKTAIFHTEARTQVFSEEKFQYYYFRSLEDIYDSFEFKREYRKNTDACLVYPPISSAKAR